MWAQMQRVRTDPDKEAQVLEIFEQLRAIEQAHSGLLQTSVMRSQADPAEARATIHRRCIAEAS